MSALANAEQLWHEHRWISSEEAYANEGPTLKRFRPRAQGRKWINKRTSHITIVASDGKEEAKEALINFGRR